MGNFPTEERIMCHSFGKSSKYTLVTNIIASIYMEAKTSKREVMGTCGESITISYMTRFKMIPKLREFTGKK